MVGVRTCEPVKEQSWKPWSSATMNSMCGLPAAAAATDGASAESRKPSITLFSAAAGAQRSE